MEVIFKTFQCYYISVALCYFVVSKFQHNRPAQSIGIPCLNMRFHGKTLAGDFIFFYTQGRIPLIA